MIQNFLKFYVKNAIKKKKEREMTHEYDPECPFCEEEREYTWQEVIINHQKWCKFEAWLENQAEERDAGGGDSVECGVSINDLKRMF